MHLFVEVSLKLLFFLLTIVKNRIKIYNVFFCLKHSLSGLNLNLGDFLHRRLVFFAQGARILHKLAFSQNKFKLYFFSTLSGWIIIVALLDFTNVLHIMSAASKIHF